MRSLPLLVALAAPLWSQSHGVFSTSGVGCPGVTTDSGPVVYGVMPAGSWHLRDTSLRFTQSAGSWSVVEGGSYLPPSSGATIVPGTDDGVRGPYALPFAFPYPGGAGSTTAIDINVNGRIYLESGTNNWGGGWNAGQILSDFLGATPSICALGVDLNAGVDGLITFDVQTFGQDTVALCTWQLVPEWSVINENTFQCQLWSNGDVVIHIAEIAIGNNDALIGVSAGGGASDPGPSPLTVPVNLTIDGVPNIGERFTLRANRLPATTALSVLSVGTSVPPAPVSLASLGAPPGCFAQIDGVFVNLGMQVDGTHSSVDLDLAFVPNHIGLTFECQAAVLDPAQQHALPLLVSNRGTFTVGEPPDLMLVADGENSFYGAAQRGGFFRLESSPGAAHPDIVGLRVSFVGQADYFDVEGNAGLDGQGYLEDGSGVGPSCRNAYYGSDVATGLLYGTPGQAVGCRGFGYTGYVASAPVGGVATRVQVLEFAFAPGQFGVGEVFGFDCDTDGGEHANAGALAVHCTVTFADSSTAVATTQFVRFDRAEGVLIP